MVRYTERYSTVRYGTVQYGTVGYCALPHMFPLWGPQIISQFTIYVRTGFPPGPPDPPGTV